MFRIIYIYNDSHISYLIRKRNYHQFLEIIWTIIPTLILVIIATPSFSLLYAMNEIVSPELTLKIYGNQWYWQYEYRDLTVVGRKISKIV